MKNYYLYKYTFENLCFNYVNIEFVNDLKSKKKVIKL